uniref:DUF6598 domain-containing protein n=1 Tax=Oryza glumipatula TaxID=40148 RepID=A0A0E0ANH1_9ORYZ
MRDYALIEYDMSIKTGEQEKDDLQLIDGASMIGPAGLWNRPDTICIPGDYGAVDITLSRFYCSAEATVEILISEVQSSFNLLLGCLTSDLDKEIRLFDGVISESRDVKRSVERDLKFKVGVFPSSFDQHYVSFKEKIYGYDTQEIKTDFTLISVKLWVQPEQKQFCPAFNNLKTLSILYVYVEFDLLWALNLLEAAPSVELLFIDTWEHVCLVDQMDEEGRKDIYGERTSFMGDIRVYWHQKMAIEKTPVCRL